MCKSKTNNRGFTLVELIVVLVILAILAAILVPALLGYIDRAKDEKYVTAARAIAMAAESTYVEAYADGNDIRLMMYESGEIKYLYCYVTASGTKNTELKDNQLKHKYYTHMTKLFQDDIGDLKIKTASSGTTVQLAYDERGRLLERDTKYNQPTQIVFTQPDNTEVTVTYHDEWVVEN
ncbi:MAG: type II secretion system protein [Eubacteriales bacterium]|nr:type II secretion system protein [Eubacteriales bacterium]